MLSAVAAGHGTVQAIARQAGQDPRSLAYYLQQLLELRYLERRYPLTGERPAARSVRYELADPLLRFWFRFIFPNTSAIRHMGTQRALRDLIRPHLDAYFGLCFERLCREALPWLYTREGVSAPFEIGQYWSKTTQIDIVGLREDGWTDLGECKWGPVRSPQTVERELEEKVRHFPNSQGATIGRRIFARQVPSAAKESGGALARAGGFVRLSPAASSCLVEQASGPKGRRHRAWDFNPRNPVKPHPIKPQRGEGRLPATVQTPDHRNTTRQV